MKKFLFIFVLLFLPSFTLAANIDSTNKYAWGENIGWIDFSLVEVGDLELTGFAYSNNIGWINLEDVLNDGEGNLSGYAWSENTGWIDFDGVVIKDGDFTGFAYGENIGHISFNCLNTETCEDIDFKVSTSWTIEKPITPIEEVVEEETSTISSSGSIGRSSSVLTVQTQESTFASSENVYYENGNNNGFNNFRDLELGMTGSDVKLLQIILNYLGYFVAQEGAGSVDNETEYFGSLTQQALIKFQKDNNITPTVGYFGSITKKALFEKLVEKLLIESN